MQGSTGSLQLYICRNSICPVVEACRWQILILCACSDTVQLELRLLFTVTAGLDIEQRRVGDFPFLHFAPSAREMKDKLVVRTATQKRVASLQAPDFRNRSLFPENKACNLCW